MDTERLKKLADVTLPESTKFPLSKDKAAIIGPITFDVIVEIEEKYGSVFEMQQKMKEVLTDPKAKKGELIDIVFLLLENKDDFENSRDFGSYVPLKHTENLMEIVVIYMMDSMPDAAAKEFTESEGETEEKK